MHQPKSSAIALLAARLLFDLHQCAFSARARVAGTRGREDKSSPKRQADTHAQDLDLTHKDPGRTPPARGADVNARAK